MAWLLPDAVKSKTDEFRFGRAVFVAIGTLGCSALSKIH